MKIYRLEHRSSGLGPFEHRSSRMKHPAQDAVDHIYSDARKFMPDISEKLVVAELIKENPKAVFGWNCPDKYDQMIKDADALHKLGFRRKVFDVDPLYIGDCGQVLFLREE